MQEALEELKTGLRGQFGERLLRVVLFGSYAQGVAHAESDVDVLAVVSRREPRDRHRAVDAAVEVMLRRPEVVLSVLVMSTEELGKLRAQERRLARDIDREGIEL